MHQGMDVRHRCFKENEEPEQHYLASNQIKEAEQKRIKFKQNMETG